MTPPLRLRAIEGRVEVDVQTLGEYSTNLSRIEVAEEESGRMVWQVLPSGEHQLFTIHSFELRRGRNAPGTLDSDRTRVAVPKDNQSFQLQPDLTYEVRVCAGEGLKRCATRTFRFV